MMFPAVEGRGYGTNSMVVVNVAVKGWVLVIVKLLIADVSPPAAEGCERGAGGFCDNVGDVSVLMRVVSLIAVGSWVPRLGDVDTLVGEERDSVDGGI